MSKITMALMPFAGLLLSGHAAHATLAPLDEAHLRDVVGQAAYFTTYTAPSGSGSSNFGFFTLGLNATVNLNANIQHLQLGCGGVNGPGCDIDLSNVSLSGNPATNSACSASSVASCDAILTSPFLRLAIANPTQLSQRQVVGIQLGAAAANGLLQAGQNTTIPNGIGTLSGYIPIQSDSSGTLNGYVATSPIQFPVYYPDPSGKTTNQAGSPYYTINGTLQGQILSLFSAVTAGFQLTQGSFWIPGFGDANLGQPGGPGGVGGPSANNGHNLYFSVPGPLINGSRISQLTVSPTVTLPNVIVGNGTDNNDCGAGASACNPNPGPQQNTGYTPANGYYPVNGGSTGTQGGPVQATVTSCSDVLFGIACGLVAGAGNKLWVNMYGTVSNIQAKVNFVEPLGFVHSLPVNTPLSLSLQSTQIAWPGTPAGDVAQPGWWLTMNQPANLGPLVPSNTVSLCSDPTNVNVCIFPQFAANFNSYLKTHTVYSSDIIGLLSAAANNNQNTTVGVNFGSMSLTPINLNLTNIQLASQNTVPNCYGGLKFC